MDYVIGFIVGLIIAVLVGGLAAYLLLRDKNPVEIPSLPSASDVPAAITILLAESFVNAQLQQLFGGDGSANPSNAPAISQSFGPVKIKLNSAQLNLLPAQHARLTIRLTATALGLNVNLRPAAEFVLLPQTGRIRILVTRILLEGVNIPREWVVGFINSYIAGAEERLNGTLRQLQQETNVKLSDIETSGDVLILKFS